MAIDLWLCVSGGQSSSRWQLSAQLFSRPPATLCSCTELIAPSVRRDSQPLALLSCEMAWHTHYSNNNLGSCVDPVLPYWINWTQITSVFHPFQNLRPSCQYSLVLELLVQNIFWTVLQKGSVRGKTVPWFLKLGDSSFLNSLCNIQSNYFIRIITSLFLFYFSKNM